MGGGASDPEGDNPAAGNEPSITVEKNAKAQLGVLSDAMVKIYELGTSPHKLLYTEITTSGDSIETIGNFNAHEDDLNSDKFYLYEVHGGKDMDADDDGIVDSTPTINEGIFRAVVKGSDVKSLGGKFKVTAVSEIQYKKVEEHIDNIAVLREKLKDAPKLIIKDDLNNDGTIDGKDILLYNPISHEDKLEQVYKDKLDRIIEDIHKKDTEIDIAVSPKIEGNTFIIAENATSGNRVGVVEVIDNGQAPITEFSLTGEGSSKFTIDERGVIRVSGLSVLSLETLKIYNLKAVATNRIGQSNEVDIRINVMEIDKTAPVFTSTDTLTVAENGALEHTVVVSDDSSVTFELEGPDADKFNFDATSKKLTFNQSLNFEDPKDENGDNIYEVTVMATDTAGNVASQNITVTVTDMTDMLPTLKDTTFEIEIEVDERLPTGTMGKVEILNQGDSAITGFVLNGEGSQNFVIDSSGHISIKSGSTLAIDTIYTLTATATNAAGESESVTVTISIIERPLIAYRTPTVIEVDEGQDLAVKIDAASNIFAGPLTYEIVNSSGDTFHGEQDGSYFTIDNGGNLKFVKPTDFENPSDPGSWGLVTDNNYDVVLKISDALGNTVEKTITVKVTDIPDVKSRLSPGTFSVDSTADAYTQVGQVSIIEQGDSEIYEMTLSGANAELFTIDENGIIETAQALPQGLNIVLLKVTATSPSGTSAPVDIMITLNDTDPNVRGIALLGLLKNATVTISKLQSDGSMTTLYTETTTDGDIYSAGRFNTHSEALEDDGYYIYEVTGGSMIDVDEDGIVDAVSTPNIGTIRAITRGDWLKEVDDDGFRVTALSELHYQNALGVCRKTP